MDLCTLGTALVVITTLLDSRRPGCKPPRNADTPSVITMQEIRSSLRRCKSMWMVVVVECRPITRTSSKHSTIVIAVVINDCSCRPVQNSRQNLHVLMFADVNKVLFKGKRAASVEYERFGQKYIVHVKKDIILSAGALDTPKLLMLSGIGPAKHLRRFGIPVLADLEGVGQRLQDHPSLNINFTTSASIPPNSKVIHAMTCRITDLFVTGFATKLHELGAIWPLVRIAACKRGGRAANTSLDKLRRCSSTVHSSTRPEL